MTIEQIAKAIEDAESKQALLDALDKVPAVLPGLVGRTGWPELDAEYENLVGKAEGWNWPIFGCDFADRIPKFVAMLREIGKPIEPEFESIPIDDMQRTILEELGGSTVAPLKQVELEASLPSLKRRTIGEKLIELEKLGLVGRPLGKRRGYSITTKGSELIQEQDL